MSRPIIISIFSISVLIFSGIVFALVQNNDQETTQPSSNYSQTTNSDLTSYTSTELGITIEYPNNWSVDASGERQKYLIINNAPINLNTLATTAVIYLNTVRENTTRLSPTAWFDKTIAPNIDNYRRLGESTINNYPAYTIIAEELQTTRHIYLFTGQKVLEVSYPENQPEFLSAYTASVNSLQIK